VVRPWWIDLGPHLQPGKTARFDYVPKPYDFSELPEDQRPAQQDVDQASHVLRSYLVLYRTPLDSVPAPILRVTNVNGGSAAAAAGIRQGDYLASYDGVRVDSIDELSAAKQGTTEAGKQRVAVVVFRGSQRLELEMAAGQMGVNLSVP
jgi:S1-C subfamily serine protease